MHHWEHKKPLLKWTVFLCRAFSALEVNEVRIEPWPNDGEESELTTIPLLLLQEEENFWTIIIVFINASFKRH